MLFISNVVSFRLEFLQCPGLQLSARLTLLGIMEAQLRASMKPLVHNCNMVQNSLRKPKKIGPLCRKASRMTKICGFLFLCVLIDGPSFMRRHVLSSEHRIDTPDFAITKRGVAGKFRGKVHPRIHFKSDENKNKHSLAHREKMIKFRHTFTCYE